MKIEDIETIAADIKYLREELHGKLHGDREGAVSIESLIKFLEDDNCSNIYTIEHLISVVKLKNGIKK